MAARATPCRRIRPFAGAVIALVGLAGNVAGQPAGGAKAAPAKGSKAEPAPVERPVVAVIDLLGTSASQELAGEVAKAIAGAPDLVQIPDARIATQLVDASSDEDSQAVEIARDRLRQFEVYMADVDLLNAARVAGEGFDKLLEVYPSHGTTELAADLAFAAGQALFARRSVDKGAALRAQIQFELVHRLSPGRKLDDNLYHQDLIDAFAKAATARAGSATLELQVEGTIWIDGREQPVGATTVSVAPGRHVICLTGPENLPTGRWYDVSDGQRAVVQLPRRTAPAGVLVARARKDLALAHDPAAKAVAIAKIQALTGMNAAVIVTSDATKPIALQLWRDREPGFGEIKAAQQPWRSEAEKVIAPLIPPKPVVDDTPDGPTFTGPVDKPKPWYRKRWVQVSIVAGVIGVIAGSIAIANASGADLREFDFGSLPGGTGRQ
jgi:hypothetical protein